MNIWIVFVLLQIVDICTTVFALSFGLFQEVNPIPRFFLEYTGIWGWLGSKIIFCTVLAFSAYWFGVLNKRINVRRLMIRINLCFLILGVWNSFWIIQKFYGLALF